MMDQMIRTDMICTNCSKFFIARLDLGLDGDHVVECPWCFHEHCRTIKNGVVTGDRWESRNLRPRINVDKRNVWKADSQPIITSTAAAFMRERWLSRSDIQ